MRRLLTKADRLQLRMASTPPDAERTTYENADAFLVRYIDGKGRPSARGYIGTSAHADFNFYFDTLIARESHITEWLLKRTQIIENKAKRMAEHKAQRAASLDKFPVGTVLYSSWGYEQTNIDFYEVIRRVSSYRVELRELQQDRTNTSDMTGSCTPRKGEYASDHTKTCTINPHGLRINSYAIARHWDGKPKHWTAYA